MFFVKNDNYDAGTTDVFDDYYERYGVAYMIPHEKRIQDDITNEGLDQLSTWDLDQFAELNSIDVFDVNKIPEDYYG